MVLTAAAAMTTACRWPCKVLAAGLSSCLSWQGVLQKCQQQVTGAAVTSYGLPNTECCSGSLRGSISNTEVCHAVMHSCTSAVYGWGCICCFCCITVEVNRPSMLLLLPLLLSCVWREKLHKALSAGSGSHLELDDVAMLHF